MDVEPPTITLDSHDGGETCRGTITIDGAYDDDLEVDTIQISFDNGTTYQNTTFEDGTWSYTVNTTL